MERKIFWLAPPLFSVLESPLLFIYITVIFTQICAQKTWKLYYLLTIFSLTFFSLLNVVVFSSYLLSCVQNFPSTGKCEYFFPFCNFLCSSSIHARFPKIMTNQTLILFFVKITNLLFKHIVSERWFEICKLLCNP